MADVTLLRLNAGSTPPSRHVMDEKVAENLLRGTMYVREEDYDPATHNRRNAGIASTVPALSPAGELPEPECKDCDEKRAAIEATIAKEEAELQELAPAASAGN